MKRHSYLLILLSVFWSCSTTDPIKIQGNTESESSVTIFFINDQHGQLENFSKIKHIVDQEKLINPVLLTASGDMFSGNPVVDNHAQKGYPMIDLMNDVGFDIALLGNHEFDYGEEILRDRMNQSNFDWVCANVDMSASVIPQTASVIVLNAGDLKIAFLGLVETNGKEGDIIPSTHPWRVQNLTFQPHQDIVQGYANVKFEEDADLLIALTHIGTGRDFQLAEDSPFFDLILGGHSHQVVEDESNGIPIFQTGSYLNNLGRVRLVIEDKTIQEYEYELIDLNSYSEIDETVQQKISTYNDQSGLDDVIGYSDIYHGKSSVGCFYTDALRSEMDVDLTFQNTGGIRNSLDEGDILVREIYEIDPFNNGSISYTMSVADVVSFLKNGQGLYYSGMEIQQQGPSILIKNLEGEALASNENITIGINDYIAAVNDDYFPPDGATKPYTTAEALINYLNNNSESINYPDCQRYFRYDN